MLPMKLIIKFSSLIYIMSSTMLFERPRTGVEASNGGTPVIDDTLDTELVDSLRRRSRLWRHETNKSSRNFFDDASVNDPPSARKS